jgi:adenylate cyclase
VIWIAGMSAFVGVGVWLDIAAPSLLVLMAGGLGTIQAAHASGRQARVLRRAFSHYLHPALVEQLARDPAQASLGGEEKILTVLFADIRGFTALAEELAPARLVALLNAYFAAMTEAILAEGGMLDKYVGDGLIAVFGAPVAQADHAARALRAALAMQARLARLNPRWRDEGYPEIRVGIGINTGRMVIGNVGSAARFDYTVLGDAVNLAARLEAENKILSTSVLISRATLEAAGAGFRTRALGTVVVRGRQVSVEVFELVGTS